MIKNAAMVFLSVFFVVFVLIPFILSKYPPYHNYVEMSKVRTEIIQPPSPYEFFDVQLAQTTAHRIEQAQTNLFSSYIAKREARRISNIKRRVAGAIFLLIL